MPRVLPAPLASSMFSSISVPWPAAAVVQAGLGEGAIEVHGVLAHQQHEHRVGPAALHALENVAKLRRPQGDEYLFRYPAVAELRVGASRLAVTRGHT